MQAAFSDDQVSRNFSKAKARAPRLTTTGNFAQVLGVSVHLKAGSTKLTNLQGEQWPAWRSAGAKVMENSVYDYIMAAVVLGNVVVMVIETNQNAACEGKVCAAPFINRFNWACLAIYTLEVLACFAFYRLRVFCNVWNVLDLVVVATGILEMSMSATAQTHNMPKTSSLKAVRVFRLMRAMKFVQYVPALQNIVRGFVSALSAMFWGILTIMILLFLVSLATVELVHPVTEHIDFGPVDSEWCNAAFSSVQLAMLFFTQIVIAGDSWGACVVPLARYNGCFWLLFAGVTVMVQLGVMNLILTAIVGEADRAHERDLEARGRELHEQDLKNIQMLGSLFAAMDVAGSGIVSETDFLDAYDGNPEMQKLFKLLNVGRASLVRFFHMMDQDRSGSINYDEFLTTMRDAQLTDWRMQMMTVKLQTAHAIQLMEDACGLRKPHAVVSSPSTVMFPSCSFGSMVRASTASVAYVEVGDGSSCQAFSRANEASGMARCASFWSESLCDHMHEAAGDEKRTTPSKAPSRASKTSSGASAGPCDTVKRNKKLTWADAGGLLALHDDLETFLDAAVANLDDELRALRTSVRQQVEDVIAATLSRTAPSSKRLLPLRRDLAGLLPLRRDLAGYECSTDGSGPCRSSLSMPPMQAAIGDPLIILRESSGVAPGSEDAAAVSELAEELS